MIKRIGRWSAVGLFVSLLVMSSLAQAEVTKIRWIFPGTSDTERAYANGITQDFNAKYASQIKLDVEFIGWPHIMEKVLAMCAGGNAPDMMWGSVSHMRDLQSMNLIIPVDKWAQGYPELNQFYPYLLKQLTIDGELYSLPTMNEMVTTSGHIRQKKIEKFWGPPQLILTWDDMLSALKACHGQDYDGDGKVDTYGLFLSGVGLEPLWNSIITMARNNGPMFLGDIVDPSKKQAWIEVLDFIQKLYAYDVPGAKTMDYKEGQRAFANGLVTFYPGVGSWLYGNIEGIAPETTVQDEMSVMIGPTGPSHKGPAMAGAQPYGPYIFKGIPESHQDAAWKFIAFHVSAKNAARFPAIMHVPSRMDVSIEDVLKHTPYSPPEKYAWYIKMWTRVAPHAVPRYQVEGITEAGDICRMVVIDLWDNKITPEQGYERLYEGFTELWEE